MRTISGQVSKKIFLMISEINPIIGYVKEMMGFFFKRKEQLLFHDFFHDCCVEFASLIPEWEIEFRRLFQHTFLMSECIEPEFSVIGAHSAISDTAERKIRIP